MSKRPQPDTDHEVERPTKKRKTSVPVTPKMSSKASSKEEIFQEEDDSSEEGSNDQSAEDDDERSQEDTSFFTPFEPNQSSPEATLAIHRALKDCLTLSTEGISASPVNDNMYKWHVKFFGFDKSSQIHEDLFLYQTVHPTRDHVLMEIIFSSRYPHYPPFLRMVYPRFHQYTGHITIGGSICVQELTVSGWKNTFQLPSFLIMIRNLLLEGGALIDMDNAHHDYSQSEAEEAFLRVAKQHNWM